MLKRVVSLAIVFFMFFAFTVYSEEDPNANVFESNIDEWTFAGDGIFGKKTNYYEKSGLFMSDRTVQYVYAFSKMQLGSDKSFSFEVVFDVPSYDATGAEKGWCWQNIFIGVKDPDDPGADEYVSLRFQHYPEGNENIQFTSTVSSFSDTVPLPEEKVGYMNHTVLFYYSIVDESLTVTVDGDELFRIEDASEDIEGHLGFGATWCAMRILKAVYTKLDETPAPDTPTPEQKDTPTPAKTPSPTPKAEKEVDLAKTLAFSLGAVMVVLLVVVVIVAIKKKR